MSDGLGKSVPDRFGLRRAARIVLSPFRTGWPDGARQIVQAPHVVAMLAEVAKAGACRRVVNAGAGEGMYSKYLLDMTDVQAVVDIDPAYRGSSPRLVGPRHFRVAGSVTDLPIATGWADAVLCSEVLEHVSDDRRAVSEIRRVLAVEGYAVLTVPTPPAPFDPAHVREGYTLEGFRSLLLAEGLEIVRFGFCMHGLFRILLKWWRVVPWIPKAILWLWAMSDRHLRLGQPMDLVVLCRPSK